MNDAKTFVVLERKFVQRTEEVCRQNGKVPNKKKKKKNSDKNIIHRYFTE